MDHTFVIPVYREAPHLKQLVESLRAQTGDPSEIVLTSSTPSTELRAFAEKHCVELRANSNRTDICEDWNFALAAVRTEFATLAHQDDCFVSSYTVQLREAIQRHSGALLAFCDYSEHTRLGPRPVNINLRIKRALRHRAFGSKECISDTREKMRLLSLGNPICCPSVMLNRKALPGFRFPRGYKSNLDWMAWLELAQLPGGFVYVRDSLVSKGVHTDSETTAAIENLVRAEEDRRIFDGLWPGPVAAVLALIYRLGYLSNRV
jgi:glycosyltransferase involved in cell wall biosynthesis